MKQKTIIILGFLLLCLLFTSACGGESGESQPNTNETREVSNMTGSWTQITQEEAKERMTRNDGHVIVDVRRPDEYEAGHIPGAILVVNEEIGDEQPENLPDLNQILLVYCRSGRRSKEAAEKLARLGYTHIYEFGGILEWTGETVAGTEPGGAASSGTKETEVPQTSALETGANCMARLTFDSFDGGGPEYSFSADEPDIIRWETERVYHDPNHGEKDGSAYQMVLTIYALKEGSTTLTVRARSPIADNYDAVYYITVDGSQKISIAEPVIYELVQVDGEWRRMTDEAIRPLPTLVIEVGEKTFYAALENNPSAEAFRDALSNGPIAVEMEDYGNYEKVGPLPWTLPRSDASITTEPGDIILYQGNKITIYYDTNTWNFTRLARIVGIGREELLAALGPGNVTVVMWIEWSE